MAAVYGPQQVLARKEDVDKLAIEVCWRPPFGLQTPADVERETTLRRTLEQIVLTSQMPRLGIRVVVQPTLFVHHREIIFLQSYAPTNEA